MSASSWCSDGCQSKATHFFARAGALTFVGANAAVALLSMLLTVGDIHRVELKKSLLPGAGT